MNESSNITKFPQSNGAPKGKRPMPEVDLNDPTRSLPWDADSEKGVLSCFLHANHLLDEAAESLPESAFYHPANQFLYKTMQELWEARKPVEYISLTNWLRDNGELDKIGGAGTLSELLNFVPTPAHFPYYCGILKDKLKLRRIIAACTESVQRCYEGSHDQESIADILNSTQTALDRVSSHVDTSFHSLGYLAAKRGIDFAEMISGKKQPGVSTGYRLMDELLGLLHTGDMGVIAGGISDGKSAFAMNWAVYLASIGMPVAYYLFEMTAENKIDRLYSMLGRIPNGYINKGDLKGWETAMKSAAEQMADLPVYIRPFQGKTFSSMRADIRKLVKQKGVKIVFIDYLQLVNPDKEDKNREREVAKMSNAVNALCKDETLGIIGIVLSQLNDEGRLRESRTLGADVDWGVFLEVPYEDQGRGKDPIFRHDRRNAHVKKTRRAEREKRIQYEFQGQYYLFRELGMVKDAKTILPVPLV